MKVRNVVTLQPAANPAMTIGNLIYSHIREVEVSRIMGKSQRYSLHGMAEGKIGRVYVTEFTAKHIVDHANMRRNEDKVAPPTIMQDVCYLSGALQMVKLWKMEGWERIQPEYEEAMLWLEKLNLIGKSRPRTRRPAEEELARLEAYFTEKEAGGHRIIPMVTIQRFQIASCRRIGETCRIKWEDLDYEYKMYWVRDVKDPKVKKGNDILFPALGDAWQIMISQPMVDERVFPYESTSISASYTLAKNDLKIVGLRLHDLRREGATRLLEQGYSADEVRLVTGHKTTTILNRVYLAPDPRKLHDGPRALQRAG